MRGFAVIDPLSSSLWIHSDFGRLVRKINTTMAGGFNPETFKAQMKEELYTENRLMMKEMMGEIAKLIKEK